MSLIVTLDAKIHILDGVPMSQIVEALTPLSVYFAWPAAQLITAYLDENPLAVAAFNHSGPEMLGPVQLSVARPRGNSLRHMSMSLHAEVGNDFPKLLEQVAGRLNGMTAPGHFALKSDGWDGDYIVPISHPNTAAAVRKIAEDHAIAKATEVLRSANLKDLVNALTRAAADRNVFVTSKPGANRPR